MTGIPTRAGKRGSTGDLVTESDLAIADAALESERSRSTWGLSMTGQPRLHCANGHIPPPEKEDSEFCTICGALVVITCPNGHEVKPAPYCSVCGASLPPAESPLPTGEGPFEPSLSTTGPQKPQRAQPALLIIGVAVLVMLVGVGVYVGIARLDNSASSPALTSQTPSVPVGGEVPPDYLGTWDSNIDNATGHHTRQLVIQQGDVGDSVLLLTADGPTKDGGTYHCVFTAELASVPTRDGPLHIGTSTATVAEPSTACIAHGAASTVTLLPDGRLQRVDSEDLTYTKSD